MKRKGGNSEVARGVWRFLMGCENFCVDGAVRSEGKLPDGEKKIDLKEKLWRGSSDKTVEFEYEVID